MPMKRLCAPNELAEGQSRGFVIEDEKLFAVRKDGQVFVYRNRCPHKGISLEWLPDQFLDTSASLIQCATHGALFLIDSGECVAGPCAGQSLHALTCTENREGIWVEA
jgi:nitrite reductase/ring-hydroxylating ferredoxin subunit